MGFVYLLTNDYNHYKIGITTRTIEKRLKELQTGNSEKIDIIKSFKTDHYFAVESWLHRKFKSKRLEGEWFDLDDSIISEFDNMCKEIESTVILLKEQNPFFK
jgi:hypothetical protein